MLPYTPNPFRNANQMSISITDVESVGPDIRSNSPTFNATSGWVAANLAFYIPVAILRPVTIYKISVNNGSVVAGNIDVGIYTYGGTRIVSMGSITQSGTTTIQTFDIVDTPLNPGLYYMGISMDNTGTVSQFSWGATAANVIRGAGVVQQSSAFPLPATITPAAFAQISLPLITLHSKVTV